MVSECFFKEKKRLYRDFIDWKPNFNKYLVSQDLERFRFSKEDEFKEEFEVQNIEAYSVNGGRSQELLVKTSLKTA